ncbi:MAG: helix-turn-helix transcriptional regulator [Rikenellaceae bacterium]
MSDKKMLNRLKVVLAEKDKTNKWLAEAIGKSENTISRWCNNKMQPSVEVLADIARALDVEIGELFNKTK